MGFLSQEQTEGADTKRIRLRNATLETPAPASAARVIPQAEDPVSGLYVIQFQSRYDSRWESELKAAGVTLIYFVPEDAFVVRLEGASLSRIRQLSYVRWLGEYRSEYKLQAAVRDWLRQLPAADDQQISVLVSPHATARERFEVDRLLGRFQRGHEGRFGAIRRGKFSRAQVLALLKSPAVLWIEPSPRMKLVDQVSSEIVAGEGDQKPLAMQDLGFDGAGVTVAVADSGLDVGRPQGLHPDLAGRVLSFRFYGNLTDASDGHSHGTHVAGIVAGNGATGDVGEDGKLYGVGVAPGASLVAQRIFDEAGGYEAPPSYETLTRDAHADGAYIGSNSWGDDVQGRYDLSAAEFDGLVRDCDALQSGDQPYILEFSAGNAGPGTQTIGSPAVAKNVIATGASQSGRADLFLYSDGIDAMADFSSRGPCEDGRIKPDVVAPGTWISSAKSQLASEDNAWGSINPNYIYQGGTSQAGPHVSGAAAVLVQYFEQIHQFRPSPAMVKAMLINSAVDMDDASGTGPIPNKDEGWGRVDLTRVIGTTRGYEWVDQTALLTSGQLFEKRILVTSAQEELKITLTYTDVPGFPGAVPALVNDLDLEVIDPDGIIYRGNQFDAGDSVPNAPLNDAINNVEGVHVRSPRPGEYIIRVRGRNIVSDARVDTESVDQDFALVISGGLPTSGISAVLLDRAFYTAPSQMLVSVFDPSKSVQSSVTASVLSSTETLPEIITLFPKGSSGLFTGAVAMVTGQASQDGRLQIRHDDTIEVRYQDVGGVRKATAKADLVAPNLTSVNATSEFIRELVTWTTDEPANSAVFYSLPEGGWLRATNRAFVTNHEISVGGLVAGSVYRYYVVSSDQAGNIKTNDNGGAYFSFTAPKGKSVLLVDHYYPDLLLDTTVIPLTTYTDALNVIGISYDVWEHPDRGEVPSSVMEGYRTIIWRVNDFDLQIPMSATEVKSVTNYLAGGGSFFMSSMEGLSRFTDQLFHANIAHIDSFEEDLGAPVVEGVDGDVVSNDMAFSVDYSNYPDFGEFAGPDFSDHLTPQTNAAGIFLDSGSSKFVGVRYPKFATAETKGRTVFLAFPFDGVPLSGPERENRVDLLRSILNFLAPGADGIGSVALDNSVYSIPSIVQVEVGDSDLNGQATVTVKAFSTSNPTGISVTLSAAGKGIFKGQFSVVPSSPEPDPEVLKVKPDDVITVQYEDSSAGKTVVAQALLDVTPPVLGGVPVVIPDYESATVEWTTSEPADSLVQFGETTRLGRTAYVAGLREAHSVDLPGLAPDRTYYFKITSRDQAGNAVEDDQRGKFYTFKTKRPRSLPWIDDLEGQTGEWTVYSAEDSQSEWVVSTPKNSAFTGAHSPVNAWASNPTGTSHDYIETFLISPAMFLDGGNRATLTFWHAYDFLSRSDLEILKMGELFIVTNNASQPIPLLTLSDEASGWVEEKIDLSPYLGKVVYLVWKHTLLSLDFDAIKQPGWAIDDVMVEADNVKFGTIVISNNLSQARFTLDGPTTRAGGGNFVQYTNMIEGDYTITFGDVPDYITPVEQTGTLAQLGRLTFEGIYTFTDTNRNGLSDAWEQRFFGIVSANHPGTLDSDADGATDAEEFQAGTDPTQSASVFRQSAPRLETNGDVTASWRSVKDRSYRVLISHDLVTWEDASNWLVAQSATLSYRIPAATAASPLWIRVEVRP